MLKAFLLYTPLDGIRPIQLLVRIILVPVIITGVWMWQQASVRKLLNKGLRQGEGQEIWIPDRT